METKTEYKLLEDGRVEMVFTSETSDLKGMDNETVVGNFYNTSVCYLKDKPTAVKDLEEKHEKYSSDLDAINQQIEAITVSDSLAEELQEFTEKTKDILTAIQTVKDFSSDEFVANNPKKFGKLLKEARQLKDSQLRQLTEIDKVIGLYNKRRELLDQKKLYETEVTKIKVQLEEVKAL